jgi:restriction system protein
VAAEVLDRVRQREPAFLERLVLSVLTAMGYGGAAEAAEHLGKAGDEGWMG